MRARNEMRIKILLVHDDIYEDVLSWFVMSNLNLTMQLSRLV